MRLVQLIPQPVFNGLLLRFPALYRTRAIHYESYLYDVIDNIYACLSKVETVEGDIIECGSARCGTTVLMAMYLKERGIRKKILACDLFGGGLDLEELRLERSKGLTSAKDNAFTYNSFDYAKNKIQRLHVAENIVLMKGLFKETLPTIQSDICLGLIDCDLGPSIAYCLESIWPRLSPGGVLLIDDYGSDVFGGARPAVDQFVDKHKDELTKISFPSKTWEFVCLERRTANPSLQPAAMHA